MCILGVNLNWNENSGGLNWFTPGKAPHKDAFVRTRRAEGGKREQAFPTVAGYKLRHNSGSEAGSYFIAQVRYLLPVTCSPGP